MMLARFAAGGLVLEVQHCSYYPIDYYFWIICSKYGNHLGFARYLIRLNPYSLTFVSRCNNNVGSPDWMWPDTERIQGQD